jgi:hypothetical protein
MIRDAVLKAYPFLRDLAALIPAALRQRFKGRKGVLTHYLMGLEAQALTGALAHLRGMGHLALPMHDGLLVQASVEAAAKKSLMEAFWNVARITPRLDVSP